VLAPVAVGTTLGATAGTKVMNRLHGLWLKWLLAVLMIYLSYGMLANAPARRFHVHLPTLD